MQYKEQIKDRLLREAAQIWEVDEPIDDNSFDPLVNMLMSALAAEGEMIYKEIEQTQNRVAQKLMSQLLPQVNKGVLPGHSIAMLSPSENNCLLPSGAEFSIQQRQGVGAIEEFRFISTKQVELFNGQIRYLLGGEGKYKIEGGRYKSPSTNMGQTVGANELLIGVELNPDVKLPKELSIYIDVKRSNIYRDNFYELLRSADFYVGDDLVQTSFNNGSSELMDVLNVQKKLTNPLTEIQKNISDYYRSQFFTVDLSALKDVNESLSNPIYKKEVQLVWLRVVCKNNIEASVVDDLMCYANVVPIVNLYEHSKIYKSNKDLSIINLNAEDAIYGVKTVSDENGKEYKEYNSSNKDRGIVEDTYLLRRDDISGFSNDSANNMINYLIGKLRNENASFAQLNKGKFTKDIKTLSQITRRLEQSVGSVDRLQNSLYLFINDKEVAENVFVDFYTTKGSKTKDIKTNSSLFSTKGSLIQQSGNFIVSPIVGGRDALSDEQKFYHVRNAMMSGDKIVTDKDITSLMQKYWSEDVKQVKVKKGLTNNEDINSGYIRTIDIYVDTYSGDEINGFYIGKQALCELISKGSNIYPYRLYVDNKQVSKN